MRHWKIQWRYLSCRAALLGVFSVAGWEFSIALCTAASLTGNGLWPPLLSLALLLGYAVAEAWIARPYRRSERVLKL